MREVMQGSDEVYRLRQVSFFTNIHRSINNENITAISAQRDKAHNVGLNSSSTWVWVGQIARDRPFDLGRLPLARTDRPKRTDSHLCKWKGQGRSVRLLTRSLRGIHVRAHVNNMADLATKLSNIPPTLLRDFLSPEEEDTLFLNNLEEELAFSSVTSIFSRRKLAKIADFFELKVSRYHLDGFRSHFWMTFTTFELLANFLAPREQMHLVGRPLNKENK